MASADMLHKLLVTYQSALVAKQARRRPNRATGTPPGRHTAFTGTPRPFYRVLRWGQGQDEQPRFRYLSSTGRFSRLLLPGVFLVGLNTGLQETHRLLRASGAGHFELFSALFVVRNEECF